MEIFKKSPKKSALFETAKSTVAQMPLSSNQYALKVQTLEIMLALSTAPKVRQWPNYGNFCKVTQNPHFLRKWKGGTKGNFSKIAQKKRPRLKGPKGFWRKWHYPVISMRLNTKDWERFWREKRFKECPNCQVMAIFERSPKTRIF